MKKVFFKSLAVIVFLSVAVVAYVAILPACYHTMTKNSQVAYRGVIPKSSEDMWVFTGDFQRLPLPESPNLTWWQAAKVTVGLMDEPPVLPDPNRLVQVSTTERAERGATAAFSGLFMLFSGGVLLMLLYKAGIPAVAALGMQGWMFATSSSRWLGKEITYKEEDARDLNPELDTIHAHGPKKAEDVEPQPAAVNTTPVVEQKPATPPSPEASAPEVVVETPEKEV